MQVEFTNDQENHQHKTISQKTKIILIQVERK